MPNTAVQQQRLAAAAHFRTRVKDCLVNVAFQVLSQGKDNAAEIVRYNYARSVIQSPDAAASSTVSWLVERTNLLSANTTFNWDINEPVTDATDAAIQSQLMSDWDVMAGV